MLNRLSWILLNRFSLRNLLSLNVFNGFYRRSRSSQKFLGHLLFDLSKILRNIHICIVKLLLGKLRNLSRHKTLLVLKKTVRASEKAVKGNYLLKESQLRVRLLINLSLSFLLSFQCLLDRILDLGIYLRCRIDFRGTYGLGVCISISHALLDQA